MKSKKTLILLLLAFVLLLGGASVLYSRLGQGLSPDQLAAQQPAESAPSADQSGEKKKVLAPDVTVYDRDGEAVQLSQFRGKPTVVNFWASWCGPCKKEMPDFNEAYLELGESVNFLMVNVTDGSRETVEIASGFVDQQGYQFPVFYDTTGQATGAYGAYALPTTFFLDGEGYAVTWAPGAISREALQQGIDMASGGGEP